MRALIVEDTLINQEFLKMILADWGDCHVVESGEEAIDAFAHALDNVPFDVIFMDIMLPGMDGLQTLGHIRTMETRKGIPANRETKAIITTALDGEDTTFRTAESGQTVSYLTKPIRQEMVEDELRKFGLID